MEISFQSVRVGILIMKSGLMLIGSMYLSFVLLMDRLEIFRQLAIRRTIYIRLLQTIMARLHYSLAKSVMKT